MMIKARKLEDLNGPFNDLIAEKMKRLGISSLEEFAEYSGIGQTTLYNLALGRVSESGTHVKPSIDTLARLSNALEVPLGVLIYRVAPEAFPPASDLGGQRLEVHVAGWVGAGPGEDEEECRPPIVVEDWFARGKDLVAFKVRGDSMAAGKRPILDGNIVIVNRKDQGHNTDSVVAQLFDGSYICKMLKDDRHERQLVSRNPEHTNGTPSMIPLDQIARIVGKVVRTVRDE